MNKEEGNKRRDAMSWWHLITDAIQEAMCKKHSNILAGSPRSPESLTGREIQLIYDEEYKNFNRQSKQ